MDCRLCREKTRPLGKKHHHCPHCDLISLGPHFYLSPTEEKARYLQHQNDPEDRGYQKSVRELFENILIQAHPSQEGLNYGSGTQSAIGHLLRQRGFTLIDYDPYFAHQSEVLKKTYDWILACEVIEHFFDPRAEFNRWRGLLKPDGFLALQTQMHTPKLDFHTWHYPRDPTHVVFYSQKTFAWIAREWNFLPPRIDRHCIILQSPQTSVRDRAPSGEIA